MAAKRKAQETEEVQAEDRPRRKYTPRMSASSPTEISDVEMRDMARSVPSLGSVHQIRVENGKMTLAETARALHKHREIIVRMVAAGRLSRDEDGLFDADEVQDMAEELAIQRSDPAIDYLKRGYELELNHKEMGNTILFKQFEKLFSLFERTVDRLATQNERLAERNYALTEEKRAHVIEDSAAKLEMLESERQATRENEFLDMAKMAFGKFTGQDTARDVLTSAKEIFEDLGEEGLAAMMPHLKPSTMGKLEKIIKVANSIGGET